MSSKSLLESDVAELIIPFLGLKDSLRLFASLSKQCKQRFLNVFIQHKRGVDRAKPLLESATLLSSLLDNLRFTAYSLNVASLSPQARLILDQSKYGDLLALRKYGFIKDINHMNMAMYTNWNSTPNNAYKGVFQEFVTHINDEAAVKAVDEDVQYWNSSRVYGEYIILFERPDGTVLVTEDYRKVYLVLGQIQCIGELSNMGYRNRTFCKKPDYPPPQLHGPVIGVIMNVTMLNWQGMIAYDGHLMPKAMAGEQATRNALKAYVRAVNTNTLITSLPKVSGSLKVIPLPEADAEVVSMWKIQLIDELNAIRSKPRRKRLEESDMIVLRRYGYDEEENPKHWVVAIGPGVKLIPPKMYTCKALIPTISEYVKMVVDVIKTAGKPEEIGIDELPLVETLNAVLDETGVKALYYVPPSKEETTVIDANNPNQIDTCEVCEAHRQEDGTKLMRCGRCKRALYCSKEHQKKHWKIHKERCRER